MSVQQSPWAYNATRDFPTGRNEGLEFSLRDDDIFSFRANTSLSDLNKRMDSKLVSEVEREISEEPIVCLTPVRQLPPSTGSTDSKKTRASNTSRALLLAVGAFSDEHQSEHQHFASNPRLLTPSGSGAHSRAVQHRNFHPQKLLDLLHAAWDEADELHVQLAAAHRREKAMLSQIHRLDTSLAVTSSKYQALCLKLKEVEAERDQLAQNLCTAVKADPGASVGLDHDATAPESVVGRSRPDKCHSMERARDSVPRQAKRVALEEDINSDGQYSMGRNEPSQSVFTAGSCRNSRSSSVNLSHSYSYSGRHPGQAETSRSVSFGSVYNFDRQPHRQTASKFLFESEHSFRHSPRERALPADEQWEKSAQCNMRALDFLSQDSFGSAAAFLSSNIPQTASCSSAALRTQCSDDSSSSGKWLRSWRPSQTKQKVKV
eukprot:TRINITY_DN5146_c0_g1_i4.p1 TRINITY_DN5146_c0_g1~~TRINITY_DN5146_c0_g1_i4.p1  ORF type:complete len:468 (+),score=24.31 TRINITY_DN5146_c0_g1_i4:107-1405(+)